MKNLHINNHFVWLFQINKTLYVVLILLVVMLFQISTDLLIFNDELFYEQYSDQMTIGRIQQMIDLKNDWKWLVYLLIPIFTMLKVLIISLVLLAGFFYAGENVQLPIIFQSVLTGEIIFTIPLVLKIIWFGILKSDYTLSEIIQFNPGSLAQWVDLNSLDPWWLYPIQIVSIYELFYIAIISICIGGITKHSFFRIFKISSLSYGVGLFTWVALIMFLSLNYH